jgi:hypothetical protein
MGVEKKRDKKNGRISCATNNTITCPHGNNTKGDNDIQTANTKS